MTAPEPHPVGRKYCLFVRVFQISTKLSRNTWPSFPRPPGWTPCSACQSDFCCSASPSCTMPCCVFSSVTINYFVYSTDNMWHTSIRCIQSPAHTTDSPFDPLFHEWSEAFWWGPGKMANWVLSLCLLFTEASTCQAFLTFFICDREHICTLSQMRVFT